MREGRSGKSGKSGKPGKPGKRGKPGRKAGKPGKPGMPGRSISGNPATPTRNNVLSMAHALLTGMLEKLEGREQAQECAACMPSSILGHAGWRAHRHCELEPDLRSPPCARVIANQHRGLEVLGMRTWSLRPEELSLKQAKAAFARLKLDNAYPLARLSQWKAFAEVHSRCFKGSGTCAQCFSLS